MDSVRRTTCCGRTEMDQKSKCEVHSYASCMDVDFAHEGRDERRDFLQVVVRIFWVAC